MAQDVPIVQPGAPGDPVRELSAEEAIEIANTRYSPDDITFMRDMIPHHNQAVQMAELVADRTNRPNIKDIHELGSSFTDRQSLVAGKVGQCGSRNTPVRGFMITVSTS